MPRMVLTVSLTLYFHPLASYCWKALIALYENGTPFEPHFVDLSDPVAAKNLQSLWPLRKFPVLRDHARDRVVVESSIVIEYLDRFYPSERPLIPVDAEQALCTRLADRFYDLYVHEQMGKIVLDRLRPSGTRDEYGVELARAQLATSYALIERDMAARRWGAGDDFTLADCSAAPALYYADRVAPLGDTYPNTAAYLRRLMERPSFARVLVEAGPYFKNFPG